MKQVRITHIVPTLRHGGAERMAVDVMNGLDRDRFRASAIILGARCGSSLERTLAEGGVETIYLGKGPGFDARVFLKLHSALRRLNPEIAHTHVHVLRYALPSLLFRRPKVCLHTVHNIAEREVEPRAQWLQKFAFRNGVIPVSVAREVALSLERRYGLGESLVIPNCVPVERYRKRGDRRNAWRSERGLPVDAVVFCCVALFRPQKNHSVLLNAFAAGPALDPRAHLVLAGNGPTETEIREQARRLNLSGRVHFLGLCDDIPDLLAACDVFILSSDFEGNPLSVMEAMAAGLPIIATRVGGVPELVSAGQEGLIVEPRDSKALADAMQFMLMDEKTRRSMGRAAGARAANCFDVSMMVGAYERLYEGLMSRPTLVMAG